MYIAICSMAIRGGGGPSDVCSANSAQTYVETPDVHYFFGIPSG
jgi:hypothetical protein